MKRLGRLLWIVLAAAAVVLVGWALRAQPVEVDTAEVTRGPFEQTVDDDGRTRVRERFVVSAPLGGRLLRPALKAGDGVQAGEVVATVVPAAPALLDQRTVRELEERLGVAQAGAMRAQALEERALAAVEQARADAARSAKLAAGGFVSPAAREQSELAARLRDRELEAARFEVRAAGHEVVQARAALMRVRGEARGAAAAGFEIRSPVSGRVLKVMQESEAVVAVGAPIMEVGDTARLELVIDVLSPQALAIAPGAAVHVDAGQGGAALAGRVRRVEPSAFTKISALGVEEQRVNVLVDPVTPDERWAALGDGYRVDARIVVHRAEDVLKVPVSALFRAGEGFAVYVFDAGIARRRTVDTPRRNDREAMVTSGLAAGDRVIVFPGDRVADGVRMRERSGR